MGAVGWSKVDIGCLRPGGGGKRTLLGFAPRGVLRKRELPAGRESERERSKKSN